MKTSLAIGIGVISLLAIGIMLNVVSPGEVGPFGVLAFFIFTYGLSVSLIYMLLIGVVKLMKAFLPQGPLLMYIKSISKTKLYYYTSALALTPVILLGMGSVGRVGGIDIGLVVLFEILACFYISRRF